MIVLIVWHTKGILQLQEDFRGLYARKKKKSTIFWIECSSDLTGRTMDIWTTTPGYYAKKDGELKREIVRYAVPYHLCANIGPSSADDANYTFVNGFIGWANTGGSEEVMAAVRGKRLTSTQLVHLEVDNRRYVHPIVPRYWHAKQLDLQRPQPLSYPHG